MNTPGLAGPRRLLCVLVGALEIQLSVKANFLICQTSQQRRGHHNLLIWLTLYENGS